MLDKANEQKERCPKGIHNNLILTHPHIQDYHKNTELKVIINIQRTWCRPVYVQGLLLQALSIHLKFAQLIRRVFFWWGPLPRLSLILFTSPLPWGFHELWGLLFDRDIPFIAACSKVLYLSISLPPLCASCLAVGSCIDSHVLKEVISFMMTE